MKPSVNVRQHLTNTSQSDTHKATETIKKQILCPIPFLFRKPVTITRYLEKFARVEETTYDKRRMCLAYNITKATDTHSHYVIVIVLYGTNGYANVLNITFVPVPPVL